MEEELEKEIQRYYDEMDGDCRYTQTARHFARWQKKQDDIKATRIARKAIDAYKSEMMKEAVEMWLARDKDGVLNLYTHKPHRCTNIGFNNESWDSPDMPDKVNEESDVINSMEIDPSLFPELTWKNEPIKIKLVRYE